VDDLSRPGRAGFLATDGSTLGLAHQPRDVQVWIPASERPATVTVGGETVRWSWNPAPFPGVVVRLHGPTVGGRIVLHGP
jgi:hypothetical protein